MLHAQEVIQGLNVIVHVLFREVRVVWLQGEVLEDFRALAQKESSYFLNS